MTDVAIASPQTLRAYMAAQFAFFTGASMMGLLYPWIYTQYLKLPADQVGLAQSLSQVPLLLVLAGGAAADGRALSSYLARLQIAFALPAFGLLLANAFNGMTFPVVVIAAFAAALLTSFIMPARDALLAHAAPSSQALTQAVAAATSSMFAGQLLGFGLGSLASVVGLRPLIFIHIAIISLAAAVTSRLKVGDSAHKPARPGKAGGLLSDIYDGLGVTWADARLRTITMLVAGSSIAMNAGFLVGLPLLVRDYYHGTSLGVAGLFVAFMAGTTLTAAYLSRRKPIESQGRVFMTLFLNSAMMFLGLHFGPPYWAAVLLVFGWGLGAGCGMVLTRSIIQAAAPSRLRARVLSVFQLSQTIGSLFGPMILGALIHRFGILDALLAITFWVVFLWAVFSLVTPVWSFRRQEDEGPLPIDDPLSPAGPQEYLRWAHQGKKPGMSDDTLPGK